jgi:hypothetical protein
MTPHALMQTIPPFIHSAPYVLSLCCGLVLSHPLSLTPLFCFTWLAWVPHHWSLHALACLRVQCPTPTIVCPHIFIHIHIHTPMIMLRLMTFSCLHSCAHQIKCCLSDSHMHLRAWCSYPCPIICTFACLYQDSQSMMRHLWVDTSDLVLVSDTGSIIAFFLTSMSHSGWRGRLD